MKKIVTIILAVFLAAVLLGTAMVAPSKAYAHHDVGINEARAMVRQLDIVSETGVQIGSCSAVAIGIDFMLTAAHCVADGKVAVYNGKPAVVIRKTSGDTPDVALLRVENSPCPCAPIASRNPLPGTHVYAIGFPLYGLGEGRWRLQIVTEGVVQGYDGVGMMASTALVAPGNSGGGVLMRDSSGKWWLVGITTAYVSVNYLGLAASVEQMRALLRQ